MKKKNKLVLLIISFFPLISLLLVIKILLFLKEIMITDAYNYIVITLATILSFLFLLISFYTIYYIVYIDCSNIHNKIKCLLKVLLFSLFYIPIYVSINIITINQDLFKKIVILELVFNFYLLLPFNTKVDKIVVDKNNVVKYIAYKSRDDLFTVNLNEYYVCDKTNGSYVLSCDSDVDNSFVGIYAYKNSHLGKLNDIYNFHIKQTIDYIKEAGYDYQISMDNNITRIYYDNMQVILMSSDYDLNNDSRIDYRLIIINEFLNDDNVEKEFFKMVSSINLVE